MPRFQKEAQALIKELARFSAEELSSMMKIKLPLAQSLVPLYQSFGEVKTPAMHAYSGLSFAHMHVGELNEDETQYFQEHVRILSAVYGLLKGSDGISSYRLEAQQKLNGRTMYQHWGEKISQEIKDELIINLASREYEKLVRPYHDTSRWIDIVFLVEKDGKLKNQATFSKMARGEMIHYACKNQVQSIEELKAFQALGFTYAQALSDEHTLVFVKGA